MRESNRHPFDTDFRPDFMPRLLKEVLKLGTRIP